MDNKFSGYKMPAEFFSLQYYRQRQDTFPIFSVQRYPSVLKTTMASLVVAFLALFLVGLTCATSPQMKLGGFSNTRDANPTIQKVVDSVANDIRRQANLPNGARLTARKYISQTVAGTNYVVEIQSGTGRSAKVIHASISEDLRGKAFLNSVKSAVIGDSLGAF